MQLTWRICAWKFRSREIMSGCPGFRINGVRINVRINEVSLHEECSGPFDGGSCVG